MRYFWLLFCEWLLTERIASAAGRISEAQVQVQQLGHRMTRVRREIDVEQHNRRLRRHRRRALRESPIFFDRDAVSRN